MNQNMQLPTSLQLNNNNTNTSSTNNINNNGKIVGNNDFSDFTSFQFIHLP